MLRENILQITSSWYSADLFQVLVVDVCFFKKKDVWDNWSGMKNCFRWIKTMKPLLDHDCGVSGLPDVADL